MDLHSNQQRLKIDIAGIAQGIGLRPFIYRLAVHFRLAGWVANTPQGVAMEIEGDAALVRQFMNHLRTQPPPHADLTALTSVSLPLAGFRYFEIRASSSGGESSLFVLPDIAPCPLCVAELFDPNSRFFRYPFVSCCQCGPRFSIMRSQPYDRSRTAMAGFALCPACRNEYTDAGNRRFHAQTLACAECGPQLTLFDAEGALLAADWEALQQAVAALRDGKVVALKGIGGYQLLTDAANQHTVLRLRASKHRPEKPLAIMVANIGAAAALAHIGTLEQEALLAPAAPIVLLQRRADAAVADAVAPRQSLLGIMLPSSPLHHLLLHEFGGAVVATSGNRQDEPLCINDRQAFERLGAIADIFLSHDRPIQRALDDSIVRVLGGKLTLLRRARGYTPLPVVLPEPLPNMLAVGGHLKTSVAFSRGKQIILSQHLGDLDTLEAQQHYRHVVTDLQQFYGLHPEQVMNDLHPGYFSSQFAQKSANNPVPVQHHYAHILSCMAEHGLRPPLLGIAWDGAGLGTDGELWGGEFLLLNDSGFQRFAHLRPFPLPGGSVAIREPRRALVGLLYELYGESLFTRDNGKSLNAFSAAESALIKMALQHHLNTPRTSSAGRLFDAFAALLGLCQVSSYEGQAAMLLEQAAVSSSEQQCYPFTIAATEPLVIDWRPMLTAAQDEVCQGKIAAAARKFHNTLAVMMKQLALRAKQSTIVLSGGCFQNACLLETAQLHLQQAGFTVYRHECIPPNDGGLALGQLYAAQFSKAK